LGKDNDISAFHTGSQGPTGQKGSKGDYGSKGLKGEPGLKGAKGDKGYPGKAVCHGVCGVDGTFGLGTICCRYGIDWHELPCSTFTGRTQ